MPYNPHPVLASFPLAFIVIGFALELLDEVTKRETFVFVVRVLLTIAALGVIAAFFSGYFAIDAAQGGSFAIPEAAVAYHHNFGRVLMFAVVPLLLLNFAKDKAIANKQIWRGVYLVFFSICAALAVYVGHLGGELIFDHGVGVHVISAK